MYASLSNLNALSLLLLAIAASVLGCASPGQPQPPSLHLPAFAEKLTAERNGDQISLAWTTPATTTDGERIKGAVTAVVCMQYASSANTPAAPASRAAIKKSRKRTGTAIAAGAAPSRCDAVKQIPSPPGAGKAVLDLTPALASGPPLLLAYAVELQNAKGRSAGPSAPAYVGGGTAPSAVVALDISPRREGALVRWKAAPEAPTVELKRILIAPLPTVTAKPPKPSAPFAPGEPKAPARQVLLRSDPGHDAGGMLDPTAADGSTYSYVAQRVQTVMLAGHTLELRSAPSAAAPFTYRDTFPPRPPTGLVLVPGGGFGETPSIDLAWDANYENDMAGYNVYRREGSGEFVKLTPEPVPVPAFRDLHVQPGRQYTYRISAVDQRHNESAPGTEAAETLRKE